MFLIGKENVSSTINKEKNCLHWTVKYICAVDSCELLVNRNRVLLIIISQLLLIAMFMFLYCHPDFVFSSRTPPSKGTGQREKGLPCSAPEQNSGQEVYSYSWSNWRHTSEEKPEMQHRGDTAAPSFCCYLGCELSWEVRQCQRLPYNLGNYFSGSQIQL